MLHLIRQLLPRFLLSLEPKLELFRAVAAIALPDNLRRLRRELIVGLGGLTVWSRSLTFADLGEEIVVVFIAYKRSLHSTTIATAANVAENVHFDRENQYQPENQTVHKDHEYIHLTVHSVSLICLHRITVTLRILSAEPSHIFQSSRVEHEGAHGAFHGEQLGKPVDEVANNLSFRVESDGN